MYPELAILIEHLTRDYGLSLEITERKTVSNTATDLKDWE